MRARGAVSWARRRKCGATERTGQFRDSGLAPVGALFLSVPLFAQVFQRELDSFVVHFLIVGTILIAAAGAAMEELNYHTDRPPRRTFNLGRASKVYRAIEVIIDHVVVEGANRYSGCLIADAKHFGSRSYRGDVLVAPNAILIPQARDGRRALALEPDALGSRSVAVKVLGVRHFDCRHEVDDNTHLLTLGGLCGRECKTEQQDCKQQGLRLPVH